MKIIRFPQRATQLFQNTSIVLIALLIYILILINRSPNLLRPLSALLRTAYTIVFPILFLILVIVFSLPGKIGKFLSLTLTLAIFSLALAGAWVLGVTESGILSGVVPMFDSYTYYIDALRLLIGENFSITSSRRPIFSAFFSVLLFISKHNLLVALGILNLLVALSCYYLAHEIQKTHGTGAAVFILLILFIYYRFHSGAVRTESLGVALSALGTAFLWRSIAQSKDKLALAGIFLLAIAMIARAGSFFALPMIILWGGWKFRPYGKKISWKFIVIGIGLVITAFAINQLIISTFGTKEGIPFGNFSYSFYGLAAGGKSWAYVQQIYPGASEETIYKLAWDLILEDPSLIVKGALYNWKMFFSNTGYGMFSFMTGESLISNIVSYMGMCLLCLISLGIWIREPANPYLSFIGSFMVGVFLSIPFLPPTDAFRVRAYAASIVLFGLLPAMSLYFIFKNLNISFLWKVHDSHSYEIELLLFSVIFLGAILIGPFMLYKVETPPILKPAICSGEETSLVIRYDAGTAIHLVSQKSIILDWAPTYKIGTFRRNLHDFPNFAFAAWADRIKPGNSLFYALDFRTQKIALIVIKTDFLPKPPEFLEVCGSWETDPKLSDFKLFKARSATFYKMK